MIIDFLASYVTYWPLAAFLCLLLAGFNLPVSEDAIIIASAAICSNQPELLVPTIVMVYLGIIGSDVITYYIGFLTSRKFKGHKRIRRILNSNKTSVILNRLEKHGFITFISTRFIPFGIRNVLFLSSGFFHLKFWKFILFDFTAAIISSQSLFWSVYILGDDPTHMEKIISSLFFLFLIIFIACNMISIRKELKTINQAQTQKNQSQPDQNSLI